MQFESVNYKKGFIEKHVSSKAKQNWIGVRSSQRYSMYYSQKMILNCYNRREFFLPSFFGFVLGEELWKEQSPVSGDCPTCVGGFSDTLGSCAGLKNCISTYDDRPGYFIAPWEYDGSQQEAMLKLKTLLDEQGATILQERNNYVYVVFESFGGLIDDVEFLFPQEDNTLSVRSASRVQGVSDFGRNERRLERIRIQLGWENVPVLRNRQRLLGVVESPFDSFGPEPPFDTDQIIKNTDVGDDGGSLAETILQNIEDTLNQ
eukprot:TRINITY_DN10336_c0_g1_i1.p2 TRINITY_DN10336_c0_g1~~TRINITY_DN10336_c0_g1_i1.p2  ORF type:complete len:261 (-),score=30.00 TRINITY_DN10336_c0_g1_i1:160-942(-)